MDELLSEFIAETRETLEPLASEIVVWEAAPDDRARLDAIFRFVHTVKGSCGFLDLPRLERLSHAAEGALAEVRAGDRVPDAQLVTAVLAIIDRIGEYVEALAAGETFPDEGDEALILALEKQGAVETVVPLFEEAAAFAPTPAVPVAAPAASSVPAPSSAAAAASAPRAPARSIRLPVELLDRMMAGVSDMVLARNELSRRLRDRGGDAMVDAAFERLSACVAEMRESITRTRMQRIDGLFSALPRMVRDLSAELGKQVHLVVDGGDVELDREMIEMIRDPLTHIVRNAIDHGIEAPDARIRAAKPMAGTLRVEARQSGNQILIEVADDGRGIDEARLVEKAISAGILSRERALTMRRSEKLELIFAAGLSTAQAVTAISGRGVGMDVVRANVERIGGTVEIDTQIGRGCRLILRVPMTLTIIPALTFAVGPEMFAIPRGAVDEIVRVGRSVEVETVGSAPVARIRGERVPVVVLADLLGLLQRADQARANAPRATLIVVRASSGERYALWVDSVQDHEELVVKPAAPAIMATGIYAGTTLPDNGRPMLLIDPAGVAQVAGVRASLAARPAQVADEAENRVETVATLLFRALDGVSRAIRLGLVERIEDVPSSAAAFVGGRLTLAHDGRVLALFGLTEADLARAGERLRVLLLGDGSSEIAYAIAEVIDIHELPLGMTPAREPGPIAGVTLVEGRQVELVDPFWLFGEAGERQREADRPLCLLDGQDAWMREVLRPIVEQAGYRVGFTGEHEGQGAVALLLGDKAGQAIGGEAPVIRLRATPEHCVSLPGSVYRYDRGALIAALSAAQAGS
jgi:two-component system, chemotaxis family, sensor kinase CheA